MTEERLTQEQVPEEAWGYGDYEPQENKDTQRMFKGNYVCRIDELGWNEYVKKDGSGTVGLYQLKAQVIQTINGDKADNWYFDIAYWPARKEGDRDGIKVLMDDLFTSKLPFEKKDEMTFRMSLQNLKDKLITLSCWKAPKRKLVDGEWVVIEPREDVQKIKVIKPAKDIGDVKVPTPSTPF